MRVIVQRCDSASVTVEDNVIGKIGKGYGLLVGFSNEDNEDLIKKIVKKIVSLRIFEDENGKMNYDITKVKGKILSVSQFTLYGKLNGNRPSFTDAMPYKENKKMYELFNQELRLNNIKVETGEFGAEMKVSLINDGPVTIILDSKEI